MTPPDPTLRALLYEALTSPIGLLCAAEPDFDTARQKLYATRKLCADPQLSVLQIRSSPFSEGNLVITKSTVKIQKESSDGKEIPTT